MIEEIRPDFFRLEIPLPDSPLKFLNSYLIRSSDRNLIIDTGFDRKECYEAMCSGIQQLRIDMTRTDFFVTHLHVDHFGLVSELVTDSSNIFFNQPEKEHAKTGDGWDRRMVFAMENGFPEEELRAALASHPGYKLNFGWVPESKTLNDGDDLTVGGYRLLCISTPGHSLGHSCLYEPDARILVAGDHILKDISPYIACWVDEGNPLKTYLKSLDKVNEMEIDLVLPGHRKPIVDHKTRIAELKRHHLERLDELVSVLSRRTQTAYQAAARMSWDVDRSSWTQFPPTQKWFATGEVIAHLHYLEEIGSIYRQVEGGIVRFAC